jgi:anti-sigma-K factor RskA
VSDRTRRADLNSGAYVLNALDHEEKLEFEAQLAESEELRNEVTELTDTAVLLGMAVTPVAPSAQLKDNIMGKLATTPQLTRDVAPVRTIYATTPAHRAQSAAEAPPTALSHKAQVRWFQRPMMVAAAAVAAVLIVGGGVIGGNAIQNNVQHSQQADALTQIYSAADFQSESSTVSTGGKATLVYSKSLGKSALIMHGMAALPSNKVYELWYIDSKGVPTKAGLVGSDDRSTARVLDGTLSSGSTVGVTIEPAGGSQAPTSKPIVAIASA